MEVVRKKGRKDGERGTAPVMQAPQILEGHVHPKSVPSLVSA